MKARRNTGRRDALKRESGPDRVQDERKVVPPEDCRQNAERCDQDGRGPLFISLGEPIFLRPPRYSRKKTCAERR